MREGKKTANKIVATQCEIVNIQKWCRTQKYTGSCIVLVVVVFVAVQISCRAKSHIGNILQF